MIGKTEFQVTARLDADGKASAKVTGVCAYGTGDNQRTASASVDIEDKAVLEAIGKALGKATTATVVTREADEKKGVDEQKATVADIVDRQARDSALESAYVATRKKEEL